MAATTAFAEQAVPARLSPLDRLLSPCGSPWPWGRRLFAGEVPTPARAARA